MFYQLVELKYLGLFIKTIDMKKSKSLPEPEQVSHEVTDFEIDERNSDNILKELEIPERTQKPPSAEVIARLNEIASKPPFSDFQKVKETDTR